MYILTITDTNLVGDGGIELFFANKEKRGMIGAIELILDKGGETIRMEIDFIPSKKD